MIKYSIMSILASLLLYLLIGFYFVSLDISEWNDGGRLTFSVLVGIMAYATLMFGDLKDKEDEYDYLMQPM